MSEPTARWLTKPEIASAYGSQMPLKYSVNLGNWLVAWYRRGWVRRQELNNHSHKRIKLATENGVKMSKCTFEYNASDIRKLLKAHFGLTVTPVSYSTDQQVTTKLQVEANA
jgi:hypothetical protein